MSQWLDNATLEFGDQGDCFLQRTAAGTVAVKDAAGAAGTLVAAHTGDVTGAVTVPTGKTAVVTDADGLTVGGKIIRTTWAVDAKFLATSVDQWIHVAIRASKVLSVKVVYGVAGGSGATVIARKVTDVSAPGASAGSTVKEFTKAAFDLTATANTIQTGVLSDTASDYTLAAGDKIGLKFAGTLTALAGALIVIELQAV